MSSFHSRRFCLLFALVGTATANNGNGGDFGSSPSSSYLYAFTQDYNADEGLSDASASVVSSATLYEGGCSVSSEALMCHGGDDALAYISDFATDFVDTDDEDDDDDNDDNDGHSSMLSNASLHRSRKVVAGGGTSQTSSGHESSLGSVSIEAHVTLNNSNMKTNKSSAQQRALMIRGGAAAQAGAVGNELAKKLLVTALVTLVFEGCIGHVLEFFKIVMQTSPAGTTYGKVYSDITSEKGISGLWDGFVPWGVVQSVLKGGVFGLAHATAIKFLVPYADKGTIPMALALTMAGGIGGGFQGYVLSPTLLMKTRVMTNPVFRERMSMLKTTWLSFLIGAEVVQKEGFGTLMKGANVFATKRVFDWSSRYFFSDLFEAIFTGLKGSPLTTVEKSLSSLLGGVASTCVTLPLDVLVAKTQDAKKAGVQVSAVKLFMDELNEKGWSGLRDAYMRGFEARLLHVCLTTVVIKTGTPIAYNAIYGPKDT